MRLGPGFADRVQLGATNSLRPYSRARLRLLRERLPGLSPGACAIPAASSPSRNASTPQKGCVVERSAADPQSESSRAVFLDAAKVYGGLAGKFTRIADAIGAAPPQK